MPFQTFKAPPPDTITVFLAMLMLVQYAAAWSCYCRNSDGSRDCTTTANIMAELQYMGQFENWSWATNNGGCHVYNINGADIGQFNGCNGYCY
ncbi:hypothetical protein DM01DRAFT_1411694 [Hesseltinella vesiculosa]|uniref:Secreted protein n=1 Tax=Hesseltinella vesiculosa TaxID=101127 RepID=A0A1X2G2M4_9FUNG|nr:hypothetical protein DM01DRAFT_1411694 [Hesseltinella vesiculosa]